MTRSLNKPRPLRFCVVPWTPLNPFGCNLIRVAELGHDCTKAMCNAVDARVSRRTPVLAATACYLVVHGFRLDLSRLQVQ
ncbi:hypothetical protein AUP68_13464 [Ilyonectria robusta]